VANDLESLCQLGLVISEEMCLKRKKAEFVILSVGQTFLSGTGQARMPVLRFERLFAGAQNDNVVCCRKTCDFTHGNWSKAYSCLALDRQECLTCETTGKNA
jgi:hypothetical protein